MKLYSLVTPALAVAALAATVALGPSSFADVPDAGDSRGPALELRDAGLHFQLETSAPKADSTVAPTTTVQLWFSQVPQAGTTQIRVMKGEVVVPMSDATPDPEDATSYVVTIERPLSPGAYRVLWRSMAADGHVVNGDFGFEVAADDPSER